MPKRLGETSYYETSLGIISRSQLVVLEIEGIQRAWDYVLEERAKHKVTVTPTFILKLQQVGFGWIFPEMAGKFRSINVTISHHQPPVYYEVPMLMKNYCDDCVVRLKQYNDIDQLDFLPKLIEDLAWIHHRFLWIHPFKDYNGRIRRSLVNVVLLNLNLPPIEFKVETVVARKHYIQALQRADEGEYKPLEKLIYQAIIASAESVQSAANT